MRLEESRTKWFVAISHYRKAGVTTIRWCTSGGRLVCALCAAREGRVFTLAELAEVLAGEFCRPKLGGIGCRCYGFSIGQRESFSKVQGRPARLEKLSESHFSWAVPTQQGNFLQTTSTFVRSIRRILDQNRDHASRGDGHPARR